jgi:hypothetical protein
MISTSASATDGGADFAEDVEAARISAMQKYAVAGLGVTPQGGIPGTSAEKLAWDAIEFALNDAGIERHKVNGYIYQPGFGERTSGMAASRVVLSW